MHLLQLPTDIVIVILSYVIGVRDLLTCDQVCKAIHSLFKSSPRLSHSLALARAGLIDRSHDATELILKERSKLLRILEQSWHPENLLPRRQLKVEITDPCTKCQVYDGVVVSGILPVNGQHLQALKIYRLQSSLTGQKAKLWKHDLAGASVEYFKADPAQDLLVLVKGSDSLASGYANHSDSAVVEIHLRTISSNTTHPSAFLPSLQLDKVQCNHSSANSPEVSPNRVIMRIYLDILGVFIKHNSAHLASSIPGQVLTIWQWTSGQLLASICTTPDTFFSDFTFLERDQVLLTHPCAPAGPSISTMRLICGQPYSKSPSLEISSISSFKAASIFQLPAPFACVHQCVGIPNIEIINEPISNPSRTFSSVNSAPNTFMPNPSLDSTIIGFSIPVRQRPMLNTLEGFIKHTLLTRASLFSFPVPASLAGDPVRLEYSKWSTRGVHWLSGSAGFLYGQRFAQSTFDRHDTVIDIYDFNPCHVAPRVSGWQTLIKIGRDKSSTTPVPKMSLFRPWPMPKCTHKYYFDHELKSSMQCKRQTMRAGITYSKSVAALDSERIILIGAERGGFLQGFTAYNI